MYNTPVTTLIFGAGGFMGSYLKELYPDAHTPRVDIADPVAVAKILDEIKPDVVINAAGKTGKPNVDWCEDHKMETLRSNVTGPLVLLEECTKRKIYMVHIGSGCIYQGPADHAFTEDEFPNFTGSFYSLTKFMSDQLLKPFPVLQLRLRMPFDGSKNARNLITKLVKYPKVLDTENSLTYLPDFFAGLKILIDKRATGIFNAVNPGLISPYAIMERYKKIVDPNHTFERLTLNHLGDVVKAGRSNCILSSQKMIDAGVKLKPVDQAVDEALAAFRTSK